MTSLQPIEKKLKNTNYQYIRLVYPYITRKNEALGGFQVYPNTGNVPLTGNPISSVRASKTFYSHIFDNNPFTFVQLLNKKYADFNQYYDGENLVIPDAKTFWVGLNLKKKTNIASLQFCPRTDDNAINKNEQYELFYWNKDEWKSLGQKKAISNKLTFKAPENALFLLKNVNKGKEHRPFLIQKGEQIWY